MISSTAIIYRRVDFKHVQMSRRRLRHMSRPTYQPDGTGFNLVPLNKLSSRYIEMCSAVNQAGTCILAALHRFVQMTIPFRVGLVLFCFSVSSSGEVLSSNSRLSKPKWQLMHACIAQRSPFIVTSWNIVSNIARGNDTRMGQCVCLFIPPLCL